LGQKLGKIAVLFSFCVLGETKHF